MLFGDFNNFQFCIGPEALRVFTDAIRDEPVLDLPYCDYPDLWQDSSPGTEVCTSTPQENYYGFLSDKCIKENIYINSPVEGD